MRVVIYHSYYGCETGCCGHVFYMGDDDDDCPNGEFEFEHPFGADFRAWAEGEVTERFGAEHVADLDWDRCLISDD